MLSPAFMLLHVLFLLPDRFFPWLTTCTKDFTYIFHLNTYFHLILTTALSFRYHYPHFSYCKWSFWEMKFSKVTQLGRNSTRLQTQAVWPQNPLSVPQTYPHCPFYPCSVGKFYLIFEAQAPDIRSLGLCVLNLSQCLSHDSIITHLPAGLK